MFPTTLTSRFLIAALVLTLLAAFGCGGSGVATLNPGNNPPNNPPVTTPPAILPGFAYVINQDSDSVSAYAVDAGTGALTPVPGSPFPTDSTPVGIAAAASGRLLYVTNALGPSISAYTIDSTTGALTQVAGSPFAADSPTAIAVDPAAKFAYVANFGGQVAVYSIGPTGALTATNAKSDVRGDWRGVTIATGEFLYAADPNGNRIAAFTLNSTTGALTSVAGSPFPSPGSPWSVTADPAGKVLYAASATANAVSAFSIAAASGALTPVSGSPFASDIGSTSVATDAGGKFVFTANAGANSVSAFAIGSGGGLTPAPGSPFKTPARAFGVTVDPSGKFVYLAEMAQSISGDPIPGDVLAFSIGAGGALTPVPGSPFPAGVSPRAVVVIKKAQ